MSKLRTVLMIRNYISEKLKLQELLKLRLKAWQNIHQNNDQFVFTSRKQYQHMLLPAVVSYLQQLMCP
jgi:hypothetical protein